MHSLGLALVAPLGATLALSLPGDVDLSFDSRADQAWRVEFERSLALEFGEVTYDIQQRGSPRNNPIRFPGDGDRREETRSSSWTDAYREVENGELRKLERTYVRLARTQRTSWDASPTWGRRDGGSATDEATSDLVDKPIAFEWNALREEFDVEPLPYEYVDRQQLDTLRADASPRALLPGRNVRVGDVWLTGPSALLELLEPDGSIAFESQTPGLFDEFLGQRALEALTGELRVRLDELDEQCDVTLATIAFEGRLEVERLTDEIPEIASMFGAFQGPGTRATSIELACHGELILDVVAHHWRSVRCVATITLAVEDRVLANGGVMELTTTRRSKGELKVDARCEPARD